MTDEKGPPITIKTEPGTYKRLPSFRSPRDLNLSEFKQPTGNSVIEGRTKKVYKPNFVQRKKQTEEVVPSSNHNSTSNHERGGKTEGRGRGRGKRTLNLIQGTGVFSEGLACTTRSARWGSKSSSNSTQSTGIPRPKLDKIEIDKEEEKLVMSELMRDDFPDDPEYKPNFAECPVQLPLCGFERHFFKKEEEDPKNFIKDCQNHNGVKVKSEFSCPEKEEKPRDLRQMTPLSVQELLLKSSENTYIFLQLPSCMPGPKIKIKQEFTESDIPTTSKSQAKAEEAQTEERTVLRTLPPGRIGTLQILKSGRARLVLGDAKLWVEPGTNASLKQDLMSIPLNSSTLDGSMINLGPVTTRMIVTPDWESMLKK